MIGLTFRETMAGDYHLATEPGRDRPMAFTLRASLPSLRSLLLGSPLFSISGEVVAAGLADHKVLRGTLCIDPFRGRVLVYAFDFNGNDGLPYTFQGRKVLSEGNPLQAMTVLPGGLYASGKEIGRALLRFDLRGDLLKFLGSFQLVRS